jgi:hypothetical protein
MLEQQHAHIQKITCIHCTSILAFVPVTISECQYPPPSGVGYDYHSLDLSVSDELRYC